MPFAFLTTQVKYPDEDYWGKLKIVLKYLKSKIYMKLTFLVNSVPMIRWWVDASYNSHGDCKGHIGAMMSRYVIWVNYFIES